MQRMQSDEKEIFFLPTNKNICLDAGYFYTQSNPMLWESYTMVNEQYSCDIFRTMSLFIHNENNSDTINIIQQQSTNTEAKYIEVNTLNCVYAYCLPSAINIMC